MHRITVIGRLGRDPEMRYTLTGQAVTSFSLASDNKRNGENNTEWFNCSAWGKLADICNQYLTKGSQVYVEGPLTKREYETKDGEKRSSLEVNVNNLQMLGGNATASYNAAGEYEPAEEEVMSGKFDKEIERWRKKYGKYLPNQ